MKEPELALPPHIAAKVVAFLRAGLSGQITLNVLRGQILTAELREVVRGGEEVR